MFINFTPFPNAHCISRTLPSFCWSVTWPSSTSSKAQASHKFTEFPLFHWWPPKLWAIAQDNFTDLVTNNNFHFQDPFIGSFNHSYFLSQTVSKNNTPFSALLPTLHHNLYLLPITFFSSQFLQAANINTTSLQSHTISSAFLDNEPTFHEANWIQTCATWVFPVTKTQVPSNPPQGSGVLFLV